MRPAVDLSWKALPYWLVGGIFCWCSSITKEEESTNVHGERVKRIVKEAEMITGVFWHDFASVYIDFVIKKFHYFTIAFQVS